MGKLNSLDLAPEVKNKLSNVTKDIEGFKISGSELNLPSFSSNSNISAPAFDNLNLPSTQSVPGLDGLEAIKGEAGTLPDVAGKAGDYTNTLQQVGSGNLSGVKELPETAESKAEELSGIKEVTGQTEAVDRYKDMAGSIKNPDSLNGFVKQEIKRVAVNHFAGKEEQLKEAMETISKYKNKYSSLNSLADIKNFRPTK